MLQNFTDEEIEKLLDTGELCLDGPDKSSKWIERIVDGRYQLVRNNGWEFDKSPMYHRLTGLLVCEHITFNDIRTKWYYQGVLLDSPKFQAKLVKE